MKTFYLYIVSFFLVLGGCKEDPKPKVKYDNTAPKAIVVKDTSKLEIADLPVQFQNANVLVYPIGDFKLSDTKNTYDSERNADKLNLHVANTLEDEITGYIRNVKFQEFTSDSLHVLTEKVIMIERMTYLKGKKILVYVVSDADTNQDTNVDTDDIKSLYISTDMGKNFTKVSPEVQELIDWNYVEGVGKLFFRTIEDANKNGAFDSKDKFHYFSLKISEPNWSAKEYFPVL